MVAAFSDLVSGDCYAGTSAGEKVLPCIICAATRAVQPFQSSAGGPANYLVQCEIIVKDNASTASAFDDIADAAHSRAAAAGFAASLTDSELTVFGETEPQQIERSTDGDVWVQTITITVECRLQSTA
jgi:hypothetical protein